MTTLQAMRAGAAPDSEATRLGLDLAAYLQRFADARLIRYWARNPGGNPSRAQAVGMLIGRLRGSFTPSPKLLRENELWRERLLAELLGPDRDQDELERLLGGVSAARYAPGLGEDDAP